MKKIVASIFISITLITSVQLKANIIDDYDDLKSGVIDLIKERSNVFKPHGEPKIIPFGDGSFCVKKKGRLTFKGPVKMMQARVKMFFAL